MPLTFAHPAAAIPLRRYLGRSGVFSALVIGSLTPDLAYFLPWNITRSETHGAFGLLWFCLPAGLAAYVLFHVLLKGPLLGLLPQAALRRFGAHTSRFRSLPAASWTAVLASLLSGAVTHVAWDAFTHAHAPGVAVFPILDVELFTVETYHVHGYTLLQHGSTVVGLVLLAVWSWQWFANQSPRAGSLPVTLSPAGQFAAVAVIVGISAVAALWAGVHGVGAYTGMAALQAFLGEAIFTGVPTLGLTVFAYSVVWHVWSVRHDGVWRRLSATRP